MVIKNIHIFLCTPLLLFATTSIFSAASAEKLYKWVDENGQVHFSQQAPVNHKPKKLNQVNIKVHTPTKEQIRENERLNQKLMRKEQQKKRKIESEQRMEKYAEQNKKYQETRLEKRKQLEEKVIDDCRSRREIYCDKGAAYINAMERQKEIKRRQQTQAATRRRNQNK